MPKPAKPSGKPIGDHQHNAFKLAEMATDIEMGGNLSRPLIEEHIAGKDIVQKVSMAKYWLGEMVTASPTKPCSCTAVTATWMNIGSPGSTAMSEGFRFWPAPVRL